MSLIVITPPYNHPNEIDKINLMFNLGLECLHLRKPYFQCKDYVDYLQKIDNQYYNRIVVHQYFDLVKDFDLKGLHINSRENIVPYNFCGSISMSCHSFEEVIKNKDKCDYMFLSPIYDSISKCGYISKFSSTTLLENYNNGVIDSKVYALGGVKPEYFSSLKSLNFGGVALLGYIWDNPSCVIENFDYALNHWTSL